MVRLKQKPNEKEWLWLFLILLVAFLFRTIGAGTPNINGDEGDNYDGFLDLTQRDISIWQRWAGLLPPMNSYMLAPFLLVFGNEEWSLRLFSAVFSTLTVLVIYLLAKLHYNTSVATISALLASVLPLLVIYGRDAHPDSVLLFFTLAAILCFEKARIKDEKVLYDSEFWWGVGAVSATCAVLTKNNSLVLFAIYWAFLFCTDGFKTTLKKLVEVVFLSSIFLFPAFNFQLSNVAYFVHGIAFWLLNQSTDGATPYHYFFSILYDALSPMLFSFLAIVVVALVLVFPLLWRVTSIKKDRNTVLHTTLATVFLLIVFFQARKYPRHLLLATPFLCILFAKSLKFSAPNKKSLALLSGVIVLLTAHSTIGYIIDHSNYTVWGDVGGFVLGMKNTTVYVDGVEYWTLKYYTKYERKIVSRTDARLLNVGDWVIVHDLNPNTPFYVGSPLQNDLTFHSPEYAKQYFNNQEFYNYTFKHGEIVAKFVYDKHGNNLLFYEITSVDVSLKQNQSRTERKRDKLTQLACDLWSGETTGKIMRNTLPMNIQNQVESKCTKGCVFTCDVF